MALSALLAVSLALGARVATWRDEAQRRLVSAQADHAAAREFAAWLRDYPPPATGRTAAPDTIESALTRALATLHARTEVAGGEMHVTLVPRTGTISRGGPPEAGLPIASYVESVPALAKLKRASIRVSGRYGNLDDLRDLLGAFDREPAALRALRIERDTYEMAIDVYGR